jgi:hypothetical protein
MRQFSPPRKASHPLLYLGAIGVCLGFLTTRWILDRWFVQEMSLGATRANEPSPVERDSPVHLPASVQNVVASKTDASGKSAHPSVASLRSLHESLSQRGLPAADLRLALMESLNRLTGEELSRLLEDDLNEFDTPSWEWTYAARRLSELEPQRAAELCLKTGNFEPMLVLRDAALLDGWAERNTQAFLSWALALPKELQTAPSYAMARWISVRPEEFAVQAPRMVHSPIGRLAAYSAIHGLLGEKIPAEKELQGRLLSTAFDFVQSLPVGPLQSAALAALASQKGIDWMAHSERLKAFQLLIEDAPIAGMGLKDVADALPPGPVREHAQRARFAETGKASLEQAAQNLKLLIGTADYAPATRGFVDTLALANPKDAVQWALTIRPQDGVYRAAALEKAVREFYEQQPEEALEWLKTAPLSPADYFQLTGRDR